MHGVFIIISSSSFSLPCFFFFFFNNTATTEIYTLSLHDALPISLDQKCVKVTLTNLPGDYDMKLYSPANRADRKSTRLNSSHTVISYAVFCLKKKRTKTSRLSHVNRQARRKDLTTTAQSVTIDPR